MSFKTRVKAEAIQKVNVINGIEREPSISLGLAKVYLNATDPKLATRTWQEVEAEKFSAKWPHLRYARATSATLWHIKCFKVANVMGTLVKVIQICLLMLPCLANAQFTFTTNSDGTLEVLQYIGSGGRVIIPDTTNGLPITSIGDSAFAAYGSTVTSVRIGSNVTSIAEYAFDYCTSLTNVTIPDSVASIGMDGFADCTSLQAITIPGSVTNIGDYTFYECYGLVQATILSGVTDLGNFTFWDCSNLTCITIPKGITRFGNDEFENCISLTAVTIPDGVTSIGDSAFWNCSALSSVTIPNSVTNLGNEAFASCTGLTNVTFSAGVTSIGKSSFSYCTNLSSVTIPDSVTAIASYAFSGDYDLSSADFLGNAPTNVDSTVFSYNPATLVYYLPGTTGWSTNFGGATTALWFLPKPVILSFEPSFGVHTNQFSFVISWATNISVIVETSTNSASSAWEPIETNALTDGWVYFKDSNWTNYQSRFYRISSR